HIRGWRVKLTSNGQFMWRAPPVAISSRRLVQAYKIGLWFRSIGNIGAGARSLQPEAIHWIDARGLACCQPTRRGRSQNENERRHDEGHGVQSADLKQ